MGLLGRERSRPIELSTGEQQRVGIARAIIAKPALLIADEPTGNLDPELAIEIMNIFKRFNEVGVTVLIASHDVHLIERYGVRRVMLEGRPRVSNGDDRAHEAPARAALDTRCGLSHDRQWLERHAQTLVGSIGRLWQHPFATLLTILVIGIALALPACLHVLVQNVREASGGWSNALDISIYMKQSATLEQAKQAADRIRQRRDVDEVTVIEADDALKEFRRNSGFGDALDALKDNPLPHALVVRPDVEYPRRGTRRGIDEPNCAKIDGVDIVQLDTEWVSRFNAILDVDPARCVARGRHSSRSASW